MKAFSSFRREFKALYKPRASGDKSRQPSTLHELEASSRPWTAPTGVPHESSFATIDEQPSAGQTSDVHEHGTSPRPGAKDVAATVEDVLASNRAPDETSKQDVSTKPIDVVKVESPEIPRSDKLEEQDDQDLTQGEAAIEPEDEEESTQELTKAQATRKETLESEDADEYSPCLTDAEAVRCETNIDFEPDSDLEPEDAENPRHRLTDAEMIRYETNIELDSVDAVGSPHGLTAGEALFILSKNYITFESEDEDDYTYGPVRFILASDGLQDCAVLLMTMDLSVKIQKALRMEHAFQEAERAGLRQRQAYMRFEKKVKAEIANCRSKVAAARDVDAEKQEEVQNQLEILELLLDDVQSRRQTVHVNLETQGEQLRNAQAAANALIKDAYQCAGLMEVFDYKDVVPQELDLETEYAAFLEKLKNANNNYMVATAPPLDTSRDCDDENVRAPNGEEQARQEIINTLWQRKETLDQARRDFEEREVLRARELQENEAAAERGEPATDATRDDFDVRWVLRYSELTRELINAEAAYTDVKRAAFEAGVPLPFKDNETVCNAMDDEGLGYTISKEQELVASAPSPIVRRWLDKVPQGVQVGSPSFGDGARSDTEEWEAEEVGISDSVSLVAEGRERARIDRWRKACVAEKQE
jgi:hypothetical protein